MFLILVLAMLGAIYVLFLHNQSMLEKLFGVLIGCVYTALSVWVLAGFTKLMYYCFYGTRLLEE